MMGLDFAKRITVRLENKPRISYGGFMRFRERVARSLGINLKEMRGFSEMDPPFGTGKEGKPWPGINPIEEFLHHSDCDGEIESGSCGEIAPILEGIVGAWGEDRTNPNNVDTIFGLLLIAAMRECAEEEADLVFL